MNTNLEKMLKKNKKPKIIRGERERGQVYGKKGKNIVGKNKNMFSSKKEL